MELADSGAVNGVAVDVAHLTDKALDIFAFQEFFQVDDVVGAFDDGQDFKAVFVEQLGVGVAADVVGAFGM